VNGAGFGDQAFVIEVGGGDDTVLGTLVPQVTRQGAGIQAMNTDNPVFPGGRNRGSWLPASWNSNPGIP